MATANHNLSNYDKATIPNAKDFRFGIVVSEWNDTITEGLYNGAVEALKDCGALDDRITRWNVPGSYELIYGCKKMQSNNVDVVIAIGSVIQGETKHFDYVCQGATSGIMSIGLRYNKPATFCVLTDQNEQQSIDRSGGKHGNKGTECAISCLKMIELNKDISSPDKKIGF